MASVVQAVCPGCKHVLKMPADWLRQTVKCKHCGMVLQVRASVAPAKPAVSPPAPPPRAADSRPPRPPAVPLIPIAIAPLAETSSAFDSLDNDLPRRTSRRHRRRQRSSGWKMAAVVLLLVAGAGGLTYANWGKIKPLVFAEPAGKKAGEKNPEALALRDDKEKPGAENAPLMKEDGEIPGAMEEKRPGKRGKDRNGKRRDTRRPARRVMPEEPIIEYTGPPFPRRALVISVHNYLYANPIQPGRPRTARTVSRLPGQISIQWHIPLTHVGHLSDAAGMGMARPPVKPVIQQTLVDFLNTARAQDRLMVVFIGHAVELGDDVYLVPIEGDLENAATLIPLKWVYEKLAASKARQKVLVADVCHFSPTIGAERPGSEPMGAKVDAALRNPPHGVQVVSSCVAGQRSYETEDCPMGTFLDGFYGALEIQGRIPRPEDSLPIEHYLVETEKGIKQDLGPLKLEQTPRLAGTEPESGAAYNREESSPPAVQLAGLPPAPGDASKVRKILETVANEIGVPPIKPRQDDDDFRFELLPTFAEKALERYGSDSPAEKSKVREAIAQTRAVLFAIANRPAPADISGEARTVRGALHGADLSALQKSFRYSTNEKALKDQIMNYQREMARIFLQLDEAYEKLDDAKADRAKENKRWQVNYDYMMARVEAQIAFVYEYESMLGRMRKEFPPRDPNLHNGWRLAAQSKLSGDSKGKKHAQNARKTFDKIIADNPGTPWEVLARREKLTSLGLEWQATRD